MNRRTQAIPLWALPRLNQQISRFTKSSQASRWRRGSRASRNSYLAFRVSLYSFWIYIQASTLAIKGRSKIIRSFFMMQEIYPRVTHCPLIISPLLNLFCLPSNTPSSPLVKKNTTSTPDPRHSSPWHLLVCSTIVRPISVLSHCGDWGGRVAWAFGLV